MVLLKVLHRIFRRRRGILLLGIVAVTAQVMGQSLVGTGSQPYAVAVNPATNNIYVVNNGSNTVTVIDGATNATQTVSVGRTPVAIAVNPVTNKAYVACAGNGSVWVITEEEGIFRGNQIRGISLNPEAIIVNPVTNKIYVAAANGTLVSAFNPNGDIFVIDGTDDTLKTTIEGGKNPFAIALNPVTNRIYVANNGNGSNATVTVINGSTDTEVAANSPIRLGSAPTALAVNPVTNKIYVANANLLTVIYDDAILTTTTLPINGLTAIAVNPVTNFIYVSSSPGVGALYAVNGANDSLARITLIGPAPSALAVNSLTNRIYVTDGSPASGHVVVIDGSTNTRVDSICTGNTVDSNCFGKRPGAVAINPVTNRVYVANYDGSNVAVVDGATKTTRNIEAGTHPYEVAVNQVTNKVYVPNTGDNTVTVIDAANGGTTSTVSTGTGPTATAVNAATNKIYVADSGSADVTVIDGLNPDAPTRVITGRAPFAVAVNTVTNKAYVTNTGDGTVTVIDGTNEPSTITVGTAPLGLAVNEVTNMIVVANQADNTVTVINGGDTNEKTPVNVGRGPVAVGVNATENNFYVVNRSSDNVTVIDGDTLQRIDLIPVGDTPGAVVVNPLTNRIYVVNNLGNSVSVIDGEDGEVIDTVPTGSLPNALDLNLLTNKIYVSNQSDNTVTVIDGSGDTVSATVPTGSLPSGVAVNPVTNKVYVSNNGSGNVTEITVGAQQSVPLNIALTPVVAGSDTFTSGGVFETFNATPSFNLTVTSAYSSSTGYDGYRDPITDPPPTQVYFSVDGVTPWGLATPTGASAVAPTNPGTFTITLAPQDSGLHTLYVFAAYANEGGHNTSGTGTGNSAEISNIQRVPLLVLPNATTTTLVSGAPNGAQVGATITFTATVTESGTPVSDGQVQFSVDGKTQGLPTLLRSDGTAEYTDNSLTSGSHMIQADYIPTDQFVESSDSLTQIIYGLPASITVSGGNNQSAAVNTTYTSPLVAIVKDEAGNPVPHVPVTWTTDATVAAAGGTLSAATSTTDANGLASVNVTANGKAGSFQVEAKAVESPAQFTLTNTAGAAKAITINSGSSQTTTIKTQFPQPLTVFVTDAGGNPVQGVTVSYVPNGTTANATLSAPSAVTDIDGFAHVIATANETPGGPYTVTGAAVSVGAVNFELTNSTEPTSTALGPLVQTEAYGNTISFFASVTPSSATGTVSFYLDEELLGSVPLKAGSATLALNPGTGQYLPVGAYSKIKATYNGAGNFAGSISGPVQVTVTKKTAAGGGPALTVVADSVTRPFGESNPTFSYTVEGTLEPGDTADSAVTGIPVYTTSAVPSSLVGTYPLSVSGLVSANYKIAFQDGTVTVTQGSSTTSLAIGSANIMYGDQQVLTAGVNQGATGTVSFFDGTTLLGTASLDSTTHAEFPIASLPAGPHTITATFNGGPNLLGSTSSPEILDVTQRTTGDDQAPALTIVVRNATRPATGELAIFTYYVTGQLFNNDTYETAITGTPFLASPASTDPGTYPITISGLTSNNYTLTSIPGTLIVTDDAIGKPSTTTLAVNPGSIQYGDPITLTATMSPTVVSGRVTFYDVLPSGATVFIGDATLAGGTASFVASTLSAGTHTVEAAYSGDGIYSTSISPQSTVTVAKKQGAGAGAALTITVQNASRQFGTANPHFSFIVTAVTGTLVPGDSFGSAVTGVATYTTTDTASSPVGTTYPITVTGLVSQNYEIATAPGTLTIAAAGSATSLIAAQTTGFTAAQYGDTVTLTATVVPTTATGTVVFLEGQNVLGTALVGSGTGVASLAISTLQAGRHTITATYLGDNNVGASTSTPVTIVVSQKTGPSGEPYLIVTPNNTSRIYGQANPAFTYTVSGALLNGDTPAIAVMGVPIYSTPASLGSPAGIYSVSIVGGLSSLNYVTEFQDGTFTVTSTSLTVALTSSANPVTYGRALIFTATLPIDATGTVTFDNGATSLGTGSLSGGVATLLTNSLTADTHSITAHYGGDTNYIAAVSTPLSQVVTLATPSITLTSGPNPSTFGTSVNFRAALPTDATGTVTFLDGATVLGTGTIVFGVATFATSLLATSTHSITAQYSGDPNYNGSTSSPVSQVVTLASSTVTLTSSPNPSAFGASVILTATVTSGATGTVKFLDGTTILGTGTISSGVATLTISSLATSTHTITAQYVGDTNYIGDTSPAVSEVVNKSASTVTLASSPNPSTFGASVTLTATVTSGATGAVTFLDGTTALGTGTITTGIATLTTSSLAAGTHPITAQYGGDTNYTGATSTPVSQVVNKATSTVTLVSSLNPSTFGASVTFTATVTSGATGAVTFHDGATSLGTGTISDGVAAFTTSLLAVGAHSISADYAGDTNYTTATSTAVVQTVDKATSTVALASSPNPSTFGESVTLTATVTSGATGAVTFEDGTTSLGTGTIGSGVAALTTSSLAVGAHSITAHYGGDTTYNAGVSTPVSQVVNKATLTVTANDASRPYGVLNPVFTSTITGFVNGDTQGSATTGSPSLTTLATATSPPDIYSIVTAQGTLAANNNYDFAFVDGTLTVTQAARETTLSVNPATVMYGNPAVLTAVVGPTVGATGTVSFHEGTALLGTSSLDSSATAVLSVSTLSAGDHTITATYNGDMNFARNTSNPVTLKVTQRTGAGEEAALIVTVNDASRTTTQDNPPFSHTVAGDLVNGDTYATAVTGTPTYSTTAGTTAGTFEITVSGLTSQNYLLAFVPGTLTVVPTSSTTTLAAAPNSSQYGDPVTLTATVISGATGTASFYDGSVYLGQGTVTGGVATLSTTTLNADTHTITATYNGDATYASSTSGPATVTVAQKTTADGGPALTVTVLSESREYGAANPEFSYIVSGTLLNGDTYETAVTGVPVYSVADSPNSPVGSTFPINVNGLVSQNYTLTTVPGTLTIVTATTTTALTITTATATTAQTRSVTSQYGDPANLTATVVPTSATGAVAFSNGSTVVGTATVSGGSATLTTSSQSAGTKTITTSYQGDANHAASTSSSVTAIVTPRTTPDGGAALTITVTDASRQYGQGNPAFSYTVTGTLVNGDTYSTAVTGVPVYSTTATVTSPVGTYPVSITGGLNSANYSVAFVNGTLTVSKGTPSVTTASSQNPSTPAALVTFTATLSAGASGTVTFMDGTTVMGIGTVSSDTASFSTTTLSIGTHSITAAYSGDGNYNGVTSPALSQLVNPVSSTVALNVSPNPTSQDSPVTFTATVPASATGTVTFYDGTTVIGTGPIVNGAATLTVTNLATGSHSVTAVYGGDANHTAATSPAVSLTINPAVMADFNVTNQTPAQLIPPGASASYQISITSVNGSFTNAVTLSATNLPQGAAFTFAQSAVTPGSTGATSIFTVTVPKQSAALHRSTQIPLMLAVVLLPLASLKRAWAKPHRLLIWLVVSFALIGSTIGCGAGGYFNQPQQTYTITVTGTSGNLAHSTTATLTVQ